VKESGWVRERMSKSDRDNEREREYVCEREKGREDKHDTARQ